MKRIIIAAMFGLFLCVSITAQDSGFGFEEPVGDPPVCRGTQEVDENGNPIPDDPKCVPDPSVGNPPPPSGGSAAWYCFWCE